MKTAHRKQQTQVGFTLIELLIAVAIVAILAAIALPQYSDYVTRSQVSEGVELGAGLKAPLAAYGQEENKWPTGIVGPSDTPTATQIRATIKGKYSEVEPTVANTFPNGKVTAKITYGRAAGQTIEFETTDGGASWSCFGGSLELKWRPNACKNMGS